MPRGVHIGPGPVFVYESIAGARRWQLYAGRALFVLALLAGLGIAWYVLNLGLARNQRPPSISDLAEFGAIFYYTISLIQVSVVLLAAPAATAGAVCLDRARGTLAHMMVTDLTDVEIVLGKLAARLAPVLALVASTAPVLALAGMLGGVDPAALVSLTLVSLAVAALGCSLALAVSVRAPRTHDVLTVVYWLVALWVVGPVVLEEIFGTSPLPAWVWTANPFVAAWAPLDPGADWVGDLAWFLGGTLTLAAAFTAYAVLRLRFEPRRAAARRRRFGLALPRRLRTWWPGPSLEGNPVLWREWRRSRPSRLGPVVWMLFALVAATATAWASVLVLARRTPNDEGSLVLVSALSVVFGMLMVSLSAPTVLSEERVRGGLDVLLTTPLSTRAIVAGKWWGAFRTVPWLAVLPTVAAVVVVVGLEQVRSVSRVPPPGIDPITALDRFLGAILPGLWVLAHGAVLAGLGLALATWIRRPGRAVALSVSLYVGGSLLWVVLLEVGVIEAAVAWLQGRPSYDGREDQVVLHGLLALCPFGGAYCPYAGIAEWHGVPRSQFWAAQFVALGATLAFAAALFGATLLTFDRCLGRASGRHKPRPPRRLEPRHGRPPARAVRAPEIPAAAT